MEPALERVYLHETDSSCEPIERYAIGGPLRPGLDVEKASFLALDNRRVAVIVGYSLELASKVGDQVFAYISASFRLFYTTAAPMDPSQQRVFLSTRAIADSWPYWQDYLGTTLARMSLPPLRLPATPPTHVAEMALRAFDLELQVAASRLAKTWGGDDLAGVKGSLPHDEVMVFDALWPVITRLNEAKAESNVARTAALKAGSPETIAAAHRAAEEVTHWQTRLDQIWRITDPRVLGRLIERLTTPAGNPIVSVQLVEIRDPASATRLRAARDRAAYERAVASVASLARNHLSTGRIEAVGPAGSREFSAWVNTPDRLAVDLDGEIWNAVPLDDETVLVSKML